jgi:hypothetical protein
MSDETSEIVAQVWGPDNGWMAPGAHGQPADEARKTAALAYQAAAFLLKGCEALLRAEPDNDETLDALEAEAFAAWMNAMLARNRFRSIRECLGES